MHRYTRYVTAFILGVVATFVGSLVPYSIHPEWIAYGLPLPWRFLYAGPEAVYIETFFWPSLVPDVIFWSFVIHRLLLKYFLKVDPMLQ